MKESRRFYPNKELARAPARLRRPRQRRPERSRSGLRQGRSRPRRHAASCRPTRAAASFSRLERTPTSRRLARADHRRAAAVHRRARAARRRRGEARRRRQRGRHGPAAPARSSRWPASRRFNPNAYNAPSETARRNRAVQDIYEPGSTFKVVTVAGRARRERDAARRVHRYQPRRHPLRPARVIDEFEGHNYGVLSLTDVIVKSSNVGAIKIGLQGRRRAAGHLHATASGSAVRPRPTSPARARASSGVPRS